MSVFSQWRDDVRDRTDIVRVMESRGVVFKRTSGRVLMAKCPFHAEDTASFAVYVDQGRWHCFGSCNTGGDVFDFIERIEACEHAEAVRKLAREAGVKEPEWTPESADEKAERELAREMRQEAARFYQNRLLTDAGADAHRDYLRGRGFGEEAWKRWMIGAAGRGNELFQHFQKKGWNLKTAIKVGLLGEGNGRVYDYFRERIVIPFVEGGVVKFFSGRSIDGQEPKYLHVKNGPYMKKVVYNARASGGDLVIVEGPIDVWALDALGDEEIAPVALCGLNYNEPGLARILEHKSRVFIGLDADGTVKPEVIDKLASVCGMEKVRLVTWPGGDDPGAWWKAGATNKALITLLDAAPTYAQVLIARVEGAADKVSAAEHVIGAMGHFAGMHRDALVVALKKATKGVITPQAIDTMVKEAANEKPSTGNGSSEDKAQEYFRVEEGDLVAGFGDQQRKILIGGSARWVEMIESDSGDEQARFLTMEVSTAKGKTQVRVPAEKSGEGRELTAFIRGAVGPKVTVVAQQQRLLPQAIDTVSAGQMAEIKEVARTGWVETEKGLAFVTPGGVIGELPEGYRVKMDGQLDRFALVDEGDESFLKGLDGLMNAFLKEAFAPMTTYPALAYALLPPVSKWFPGEEKFAVHFTGETGVGKTTVGKLLNALYGAKFRNTAPFASFKSTTNYAEILSSSMPGVVALFDEYKPINVAKAQFVDFIHRYADGNTRGRARRDGQSVQVGRPMRCWWIITGEDIVAGEASMMARLILIKFARPKSGESYTPALRKMDRLGKHYATVGARWVNYLREHHSEYGVEALIEDHHQRIVAVMEGKEKSIPNANRIARNVAMLQTVWGIWLDFLVGQIATYSEIGGMLTGVRAFGEIAERLAVQQAIAASEQTPAKVFVEALQEGIDAGEFILQTVTAEDRPTALKIHAGWYDRNGVYILPAIFDKIAARKGQAQQPLGFTKAELYSSLRREGMLAREGKDRPTVQKEFGAPVSTSRYSVLHFKRDVISVPGSSAPSEISGNSGNHDGAR